MNFQTVPVECHPAYTWLWNSTITKEEIRRQINEMYDAGIRAFYVLGEPENFRPFVRRTYLSPEYLSPEYLDLVYYAYEVAAEKGMYTWLYNEGGFPSGMVCGKIREKYPELAIKHWKMGKEVLAAGKPFTAPENLISAFVYPQGIQTEGKRIYPGEVFKEDTEVTLYLQVEEGGLRSDNAQLRNTESFLEMTHEQLKKRFGEHMGTDVTMMFDDEAYMGKWTEGYDRIFQERYGYDVRDFMPYIAGDLEPETDAQYRAKSDYFMLCGDLVRENYFKAMRIWLNAHHMESVGHLDNDNKTCQAVANRYGNVLQTLREFDVPGIDVIWSQIDYPQNGRCCPESNEFFPRMASAAARQQGHSKCLSESFAVYGAQVTPEQMRHVVNYQAVRGISLYNFMVISYDRSTAMCLQYRPNFNGENPGMDCLGQINEYTARLSYILQSSRAEIKTALYYPFRTICACGEKGAAAAESFETIGHWLEQKGINFDLVDEEFVRTASVEDGMLRGEYVTYEMVLVPEAAFEPEQVLEKLQNMGENCVREACAHLEELACCGALSPCIQRQNPFLQARKLLFADGSEGYFICNNSGETVSEEIGLCSNKLPYMVDLYSGELLEAEYVRDGERVVLPVTLLRGEGIMIWLTSTPQKAVKPAKTEPFCTLTDMRSYISRTYEIHPQEGPRNTYYETGELREGLYEWNREFSGEVTYTCKLPELEAGKYVLDLGEVRYFAKVYLNGNKIGEVTMPPYRLELPEAKSGDELKIIVANTIANACCATDFFEVQDIKDVGPYHKNMIKQEAKVPAGGLFGPVTLAKIQGGPVVKELMRKE